MEKMTEQGLPEGSAYAWCLCDWSQSFRGREVFLGGAASIFESLRRQWFRRLRRLRRLRG